MLARESKGRSQAFLALLALVCSAVLLAGCGRSPGAEQSVGVTAQAVTATVTRISVSPPVALIPARVTQQFKATATFTNNKTKKPLNPSWSVSDPTIASINSAGLVTALKPGSVTVTATDPASGTAGTATLTVSTATLAQVSVTPAKQQLEVDAVAAFKLTGIFSDGSKFRLDPAITTWTTTNTAIVSVDATGNAMGVSVGTAAVVATDAATGLYDKAVVTVGNGTLSSIEVTPTTKSLPAGLTQAFAATAIYSDGTTLDVTAVANWASSNNNVATVTTAPDGAGIVSALAAGSAKITAGLLGVKGKASLTVTGSTLKSIAVSPASKSIPNGTAVQLVATGTYSDNTTQDVTAAVTWSSSSTAAFVSNAAGSEGLVTALGIGSAKVTATDPVSGVSAFSAITITPAVVRTLAITASATRTPAGSSQAFVATGTLSDATTRDMTAAVTWTSSVITVARISNAADSAGIATSFGIGTTSIGAVDPVSGIAAPSVTLTVTRAELLSVAIEPPTASIANGLSQPFVAIGLYTDATQSDLTQSVTWTVDSGSATISNSAGSKGVATGNGVGASSIRAIEPASGLGATASLNVTSATLASLSVTSALPTLPRGMSQQFIATGTFTDRTTQDLTAAVTWSANGGIATISNVPGSNGLGRAIGVGATAITAIDPASGVSGSTTLSVTAAALVSIAVTPPAPTLPVGISQPLSATGLYTDLTTQDLTASVTWTSSAPSVASVSNAAGSAGLTTGGAQGSAQISATDPATGVAGSTTVSVTRAALTSLAITPPELTLPVGTAASLRVAGRFSDGSIQDLTTAVTWISENPAVNVLNATGSEGTVIAVSVGLGTVVAKDPQTGVSAHLDINVTGAALVSIDVAPSAASVAKGLSLQFTATGKYTDASHRDLTTTVVWSSSGPSAAISNAAGTNGLATAVTPGVATIGALDTASGIRGSTTMTTTAALLTSIVVTPGSPSVLLGGTTPLAATGSYNDGSRLDLTAQVTWAATGTAASVSNAPGSAGLLTGVSAGTATVTATDPASGIVTSVLVTVAPLSPPSTIVAGAQHSCSLLANGTVQCWGLNAENEVGTPGIATSPIPITVPGLSGVSAISSSARHTCALLSGGSVACWGMGRDGGLGNGGTANSYAPVTVPGLSGAIAVAAGGGHTCALRSNGTVACWGFNAYGEVGVPGNSNVLSPVTVPNLNGVTAIATGGVHTCAILTNGSVTCWGWNHYGQLGAPVDSVPNSNTPLTVPNLTGVVKIAAGGYHTCALLSSGGVECWGANDGGQLGNGSTSNFGTPTAAPVLNLTGAVGIALGNEESCALLANGNVACWGYNIRGSFGNGTTTYSPVPVLSGVHNATNVVTNLHSCASLSDGTFSCWGFGSSGEIGNGLRLDQLAPAAVVSIKAVAAGGGGSNTCALLSNGTVACWGWNHYGQLGNGTLANAATPTPVVGLSGATAIAVANDHACALASGFVRCWGSNASGQLGNATNVDSTTPVTTHLSSASAIAVGDSSSCAITSSGSVQCWGFNSNGQLGNNTTTDSTVPVTVTGLSGAVSLAMGTFHSCALLTKGRIACWGLNNQGELGNGNNVDSHVPVNVAGLAGTPVSIAAGMTHNCALLSTGAVQCWGYNFRGQIGNGTFNSAFLPATVSGISSAASIAAGGQESCARLTNGALRCWGYNGTGQLGNGTTTDSSVPVAVSGLSGAIGLTVGGGHACALMSNDTLQCWGDDSVGELGDGSFTNESTPVQVVW
jgi:alpha-tubulin suppressor-like RCC1 family protein